MKGASYRRGGAVGLMILVGWLALSQGCEGAEAHPEKDQAIIEDLDFFMNFDFLEEEDPEFFTDPDSQKDKNDEQQGVDKN